MVAETASPENMTQLRISTADVVVRTFHILRDTSGRTGLPGNANGFPVGGGTSTTFSPYLSPTGVAGVRFVPNVKGDSRQ